MPLMKFKDFYPDYHNSSDNAGFGMDDIKGYSVYAQGDDKVGSVHDILVDDVDGRFRYFIVDTGFWVFGKKVLVPVGMVSIEQSEKRLYVNGLTRQQVEDLPNFDDLEKLDFEHEEQVRGVYRSGTTTAGMTGATTAGLAGAAMPTSGSSTSGASDAAYSYDRDSYSYDQDASLYNLNSPNQESLRLYEERLVANKQRTKTGEVAIGKHVETQTAQVEVPVERERVVIERHPASSTAADPTGAAFNEGEVARIEVYEETPDIRKEAFVREEVSVKKVVEQDVVQSEQQLRREELDVDAEGRPVIDNR